MQRYDSETLLRIFVWLVILGWLVVLLYLPA